MIGLPGGIKRLTFPLPLGIDHVHCYLLPRTTGGWILVDTGLGLPGASEQWNDTLCALRSPVEEIFVTHFHPDHVGGSALVAEMTGSPVAQGRLDYEYCVGAWDNPEARDRSAGHLVEHGMPPDEADAAGAQHTRLAAAVHFVRDPRPLEPGDELDGWEVVHLPGHADGHLCLLRDGILVAGDALLGEITPHVGIYPGSPPDPLADFLASLERIAALSLRLAIPGHGDPIHDPAGRAREIIAHHHERLTLVASALDGAPRTAYEISGVLFPDDFPPPLRRMAVAESLAHLEHLTLRGGAARSEEAGQIGYRLDG